MIALPDDVCAILERPNYAHVATILPDGGPHSVPVWVGLEGDEAWRIIDCMSDKYLGQPYPVREDRVVYLIEPESSWSQVF